MNERLSQLWKQANETGVADIGNIVVCDFCEEDYTESNAVGGILFGTYATCPKCVVRMMPAIIADGEEDHIRTRANPGETFRDFCLRLRGGDNTIKVRTIEIGGEPDGND